MKGNKSVKSKKPGTKFSTKLSTKSGTNPIDALIQFAYCLPCIVYIAVVILVFRAHMCKNLTYGKFWSFAADQFWDLSAWWKSKIIIFSSIAAFAVLLWRLIARSITIKKTIIYIPMAVYTIAVLLSFAFSQYKEIAWLGANERYEGTYILVCYMFMLFYTINTIDNKQILKILFSAIIVSQILLQIVGICQFTGHDLYQTAAGQKLVFPNHTIDAASGYTIWQEIDKLAKENPPLTLIHNPGRRVNQTVYSFNNLSFYLSAVIPVFIMLFLFSSGIKQKIFMGAMLALLFFNIWAANASGGFMGLFFAFIAAVATFWKHIIKWRYRLLIIIAIAGVTFAATNRYMEHSGRKGGEILSEQIKGQIAEAVSTREVKERIDYFINNKDSIVVSLYNNELEIKVGKDLDFIIDYILDGQGMPMQIMYESSVIESDGENHNALLVTFIDERFADLQILIPERTGSFETRRIIIFKMKNQDKVWPFEVKQEGTFFLMKSGALVKMRKVPVFGFKNKQDFGTGRGYIWSRTFPLMLKTLLIGFGADTFANSFPHDDFTGLYYDYGWSTSIIFDKPHNFILLTFVNTGGLSAIALIAILVIYAVQSYKLYSKNITYNIFSKLGAGIYLGVIAFFFAGMVYDTSVNVMPLIYGLLGIGIACNREAVRNEQ